MQQVLEAQATSRGSQPIVPPPPLASSQLVVLSNPFPHQGYIAAQPTQGQATQPTPPSGHHEYHILMVNYNEINNE